MSGGGKGGTQKSTQETKMDPAVTAAQMDVLNKGQELTAPFMQTPGYAVAGFNPDQMMGFDLSRLMAMGAFTEQGPDLSGMNAPRRAAYATPMTADMTRANASQVSGEDIQALMNPYIDSVVDTTLGKMRGQYDDTNASIGGRMAAAGAFGGSREAVQRSALDEGFGEQVAATTAQLMSAGWDQASALALANAQMGQQTELANAGAANSMAQFNAGARGATNQFNVGSANDMMQFNAEYGMRAPQVQDALRNSQMARQQSALAQLLGIGNQQQQFAQGAINVPFDMLGRLAGITPQQYNSTTTSTQPKQGGGPLGTILGTALSIGGMGTGGGGTIAGSLFSDRREKTDITKLGEDPETGEMMYAYRYKDDPKTYPKVVGPMAQDIEERDPSRVREIGGKKVIKR